MRWLTLALCCSFTSTSLANDTQPSFVDRFDNFDTTRWTISNGWSNGNFQDCMWSKDNVRLEGGTLQLMLTRKPFKEKSHSCAEIQSNGAYGFGTYEIRMRPPKGSGIVSAFFTYSGPPAFKQPHDEVDIEIAGKRLDNIITNYFVNGKSVSYAEPPLGFNASAGMNDYAFEWTSKSIKWFVNGNLVREAKASDGGPHPTHPSKLIMMLWNSRTMVDWLGPFEEILFPLSTEIEWVAYTKLGDACQFPESVVCKFGAPQ
jgi:endo-1,3-1,4-beta-glycanase ExoK